jgi:hypothetical protein
VRDVLKKALYAVGVLALAAVAVALGVAAREGGVNPMGVVAGKLGHLALFVVFWFAVYVVGRACSRFLLDRDETPPELAAALGVAAMVVLAFVMGAAHVISVWLARGFIVGAAAAGAYFFRRDLARVPERVQRWLDELEVSTAGLLVVVGAIALPLALTAAVPPYYWDSLTYHLAVPKAYADAGGFVYLPYNVYASMPMGGSLFYLWPYLWDGLITAKASHLVVTFLAAALTYRLARIWLGQFFAAMAAAMVVLTPPVAAAMAAAHNDHFVIMSAAGALYVYFAQHPGRGGGEETGRSWLAVGVLLGAAVAVKYTAYAVFAAFIPVWAYDVIRGRLKIRWVLKAAVVVFVLVLPWLAKAYVERGNPTFPLLYGVFGGRDFSAEQSERLLAWQGEMGYGDAVGDFILLPYRVSVAGDSAYERFAGIYLPFLLPLAALAFVFFRRGGRVAVYAWVYLIAWFFGSRILRFLGGALPAFSVAAAGSLAAADGWCGRWGRGFSRGWRAIIVGGLALVAVSYFPLPLLSSLDTYAYFLGAEREDYLAERVGFMRAQLFMNKELPPDAKVLLLFTNHTLYLEREAVYDSFLEASAFLLAAEDARDPRELYDLARGWGCTHVHIYHSFEPKVWDHYDRHARTMLYGFLKRYGRVLYRDDMNDVYELVGDDL